MTIRYPWAVYICVGLLTLSSCEKPNKLANNPSPGFDNTSIKAMQTNYNMAVQTGIRGHSYPGQFNELFPDAVNGISYFTGVIGTPKWYSKAGLYRRYVLRMFVDIELDTNRTTIISNGLPSGDLCELTSITVRTNGSLGIGINQVAKLTSENWIRLFESHGDFRVLGITLETNKPVEGFDAAWKRF
jgi:hypothetical protein